MRTDAPLLARASIEEQLAVYCAEHGAVQIDQVDIDLDDDGRSVYFVAHLTDGYGLYASVLLDQQASRRTFDRTAWQAAFNAMPSTLNH
jgi:hypothetical protein